MTLTSDPARVLAPPVEPDSVLREVTVGAARMEAEGVLSLELKDPFGRELPSWTPGAHIDVVLPSGAVRQYSLCSDPSDLTAYRIAVLRESDGRGGSAEIHDSALVGRALRIRGPRNHFVLEDAASYLLVAGGIGITPILAMARSLSQAGKRFRVLYGGRKRSSMAFVQELRELVGDALHLVPEDEKGMIDLATALASCESGTDVYCCGPEALLQAVDAACGEASTVADLHVERFSAAPESPAPEPGQGATGFEVELRRSAAFFTVGPEDSLIDMVRQHCPEVMSSCEEGFCGTCETRVLEGEPEHHDTILTEKERASNKTMMICVGRCTSERLVLDL
ncbi:PDR/VanB family oxidoreductase [Aeromicrobium sp. CTD01-1L150]|uniref:PDR/VanB family oxidoreductase n=1 Tax=Aeromicrobium sp. CTD01-1L150 TaxID=3341830 RepID=UPI0035C136E9